MNDKSNINDILSERAKTHGDFTNHARATQTLKSVIYNEAAANGIKLTDVHRESLDMIAHKIGRIISGNPNHEDHWADIAGYAECARRRLA